MSLATPRTEPLHVPEPFGTADATATTARTRTAPTPPDALHFLRQRDIDAAIGAAIVARTADGASALPTSWRQFGFRREMRPLLRQIFNSWPAAFADVPPSLRGAYRVAASMMALFDRACSTDWIDAKGPTRLRLTGRRIAHALLHSAHHVMRRKRWRDAGVTHARIVFASTPCPACDALRDRTYNLRGLPELPPRACTCESGYSGHLIAYRRTRTASRDTFERR